MAVNTEEKRICWHCIGENFLKAKVRKQGELDECDYCGKGATTLSIGEVAEDLRSAFERHYARTPVGPSEHEEFMYKESDLTWEREGEPSTSAIADAAKIAEAPAEDIRSVLEESTTITPDEYFNRDPDDEDDFSEEAQYAEKDVDATPLYRNWEQFKISLRTETRLFNTAAQTTLDSIFTGLDGHATKAGRKVIVDAGVGQKLASLYRARVFQSLVKLKESLKRPDLHLGPPPSDLATTGRMNARGIAVFYGATHEEVAISETRPPVGSHVAIARFEVIRPLKLLDVEALQAILVTGSIFDPTHLERLKNAAFLSHLSRQITLPVMPDDEPFEYLVTQAIADYLANLSHPHLDGLIYRSVQHGKGKNNVVLFHKSARVKPLDIPPGTEISAHTMSHDEDGPHPDFWVFETVPPAKGKDDPDIEFPFHSFTDEEQRIRGDNREPALNIDIESVSVHSIQRAAYGTEKFKVRRHRSKRSVSIRREVQSS
jgi:RES domain